LKSSKIFVLLALTITYLLSDVHTNYLVKVDVALLHQHWDGRIAD